MDDGLDDRVDAVERAITDGHAADGLPDAARIESRLDELEAAVDDVDERVAELEAGMQALRGFAGGVRAVDEAVERRANAAVARVERLESELREAEDAAIGGRDRSDATRSTDPADAAADRVGSEAADGGSRHDAVGAAGDAETRRPDGPGGASTAGRTDAALAEAAAAAATTDDPDAEADDRTTEGSSLADRIRRLL